jgi:predicted secreted protein
MSPREAQSQRPRSSMAVNRKDAGVVGCFGRAADRYYLRIGTLTCVIAYIFLHHEASAQAACSGRVLEGTTVIKLSANAEQAVSRDYLRADLVIDSDNADVVEAQAQVNGRMMSTIDRIKHVVGISVETLGYNVYEDRSGPSGRWHASEYFRLESQDFAKLVKVVGSLQADGIILSNLSAEISPDTLLTVEDRLTDKAIERIKSRASAAAATLGTRVECLQMIKIGNVTSQTRAAAVPASAGGPMPPPTVAAGEATVSLSIEAEVVVRPQK